jgi:transcriptional regulator with XRE-family HTH domain
MVADETTQHLGETIVKARAQRRLTSAKLAKRASISRTTLSNIERGKAKRPRQPTLEKIARALALSPEELDHMVETDAKAWEDLVRVTDVCRVEVERGQMSPGFAIHNVVLALTWSGKYGLQGPKEYGFGIQRVSPSEPSG